MNFTKITIIRIGLSEAYCSNKSRWNLRKGSSYKLVLYSLTLLLMFFLIFSINSCYAVAVGDSYGGGTVFCVSKTVNIAQCVTKGFGDHGLIMANKDQANYDSNPNHGVSWSSVYKEMGPRAQSVDNGSANTDTIIAAFPQDNPIYNPNKNAAWLCYKYIDPIEKHEDWYLPSKNELNKMYIYARANNLIGRGCSGSKTGGVQCLVGGCPDGELIYWSSSEFSDILAWVQFFSKGNQSSLSKIYYLFGVRAVRAF